MTVVYRGQEFLTLEELSRDLDNFIEQSADEIPEILRKRREELDKDNLYV